MDLLEKIDNKLDKVIDDLHEIKTQNAVQNEHIAKNTKDLEEHIEGVKQNRFRIEHLEKRETQINMIWKVILGISTVVGIIGGIYKIFY